MLAGRCLHHVFSPTRRLTTLSTAIPVIYLDRDVVVFNKPHGFKSQYYKQVLKRNCVTRASLDDFRTMMIPPCGQW